MTGIYLLHYTPHPRFHAQKIVRTPQDQDQDLKDLFVHPTCITVTTACDSITMHSGIFDGEVQPAYVCMPSQPTKRIARTLAMAMGGGVSGQSCTWR